MYASSLTDEFDQGDCSAVRNYYMCTQTNFFVFLGRIGTALAAGIITYAVTYWIGEFIGIMTPCGPVPYAIPDAPGIPPKKIKCIGVFLAQTVAATIKVFKSINEISGLLEKYGVIGDDCDDENETEGTSDCEDEAYAEEEKKIQTEYNKQVASTGAFEQ